MELRKCLKIVEVMLVLSISLFLINSCSTVTNYYFFMIGLVLLILATLMGCLYWIDELLMR